MTRAGASQGSVFEEHLDQGPANYQALTPVDFLVRSASTYPDKTAVVYGEQTFSYAVFHQRCRRLAGALSARGIGVGDTVAVLSPNTPPLLEAHYGVPMAGAVLGALNVRLDAATIAFILEHGEAKVLLADRAFAGVVADALSRLDSPPTVVRIDDGAADQGGEAFSQSFGETDYESLLTEGAPDFEWRPPADEWQALALNYTSGTTGNPKGVVYHHRGATLNAIANVISLGLGPGSVYLWTLPMFHCNGWTHTWAVTAAAGTHVCLRAVDPAVIFPLIRDHRVSHMCGAPIVLNTLIHAPDSVKVPFAQTVDVATGGAAPPSAVIMALEGLGFRVTHLYGLTECYGPSTVGAWQDGWDTMTPGDRAARIARQGVRTLALAGHDVLDPETLARVPADGATMGELMLRGNTVMRGYLKNAQATDAAFAGGWFHTGDLGVVHPDGYVEIKDRSKDIIISGGENISSLEVEEALYRHPDVMEAAVVARADEKWGETPCAFVTLRPGAGPLAAEDVIEWCRDHLAHFKCPRHVVFGDLPKTSTGKIQKYLLRQRTKEDAR